jgi:hypothetical protein
LIGDGLILAAIPRLLTMTRWAPFHGAAFRLVKQGNVLDGAAASVDTDHEIRTGK